MFLPFSAKDDHLKGIFSESHSGLNATGLLALLANGNARRQFREQFPEAYAKLVERSLNQNDLENGFGRVVTMVRALEHVSCSTRIEATCDWRLYCTLSPPTHPHWQVGFKPSVLHYLSAAAKIDWSSKVKFDQVCSLPCLSFARCHHPLACLRFCCAPQSTCSPCSREGSTLNILDTRITTWSLSTLRTTRRPCGTPAGHGQ